MTLPSADGIYVVFVSVADKSGNTLIVTQKVILDRTAAAIAATLSAPNNGTFYDVGTPITLNWTATDLNGVSSSIGSSEGQTISSSGGKIDIAVMTAGTHTVTISATDKAGNVSTMTLTFTIHATPQGLINAINDGAARGWISASFKTTLITQMQQVIKACRTRRTAARSSASSSPSCSTRPPVGSRPRTSR